VTSKPIINEKFLAQYPQVPPIFKRTRDPSRRALIELIENFQRTEIHNSPTGMTAEWLMKWCRDAGRSYTLTYHHDVRCYQLILLPTIDTPATS
jgi:hypothetical protein